MFPQMSASHSVPRSAGGSQVPSGPGGGGGGIGYRHGIQWDIVGKRAVGILQECFLVVLRIFTFYLNLTYFLAYQNHPFLVLPLFTKYQSIRIGHKLCQFNVEPSNTHGAIRLFI